MGRLKAPPPRLKPVPSRLQPPPKTADPFYGSAGWDAARKAALKRAGYRCEVVEDGARCRRCSARGDRMYVDHLVERKDGGADLDPQNLGVKCAPHHALKTAAERAKRMQR